MWRNISISSYVLRAQVFELEQSGNSLTKIQFHSVHLWLCFQNQISFITDSFIVGTVIFYLLLYV